MKSRQNLLSNNENVDKKDLSFSHLSLVSSSKKIEQKNEGSKGTI